MDKTLRSSPEPSVNIALVPAPSEQSDSPNSQPRTVSAQEFTLADAALTGPYCGMPYPARRLPFRLGAARGFCVPGQRQGLSALRRGLCRSVGGVGRLGRHGAPDPGEMISSDAPEGLVSSRAHLE